MRFTPFLDWLKRKPRAMKKFARDLVSDPGYSAFLNRMLEDHGRAIDEANAAAAPTDAEIPGLITLLFSSSDTAHMVAEIRLRKAGRAAERHLLAAFADPRCTWTPDESNRFKTPAASRLGDLLWEMASPELVNHVRTRTQDPQWQVHNLAIKAVVAEGTASAAAEAIRALSHPERETVAEEGIASALNRGCATPEFMAALLSFAARNACDGAGKPSKWAVDFYAAHGGAEARARLHKLVTLSNDRNPHFVLRALHDRGERFDPGLLRSMAERSLECVGAWPWEHVFGDAITALAVADRKSAASLAERALGSDSRSQLSAAIGLIRRLEELPQDWHVEAPKELSLSESDRRFLAARDLVTEATGEIGNGGLSQYFFNSSGDRWPKAVKAFEFIGDAEGASALRQAAEIVAPGGPSTDRARRTRQYASLSEEDEANWMRSLRSFGAREWTWWNSA